ncbi:hypothetical protein [Varibaculum prostatecancerukia]|uniref:hypothetical protein n=1 Tax=Varibaculum prostatecancerukia TaxID=2811781 RepID=UPI001C005388|nr:hypothetical protein [Varibaculum prostatecancerukia]
MFEHLSLWKRIKAYKLAINVWVVLLLTFLGIVSVFIYYLADYSGFIGNLAIAASTSFFASVLVLISETYLKFRSHENDIFLEGIEKLGISNLHFQKSELLRSLMRRCEEDFWAVGYRQILTASLSDQIEEMASRNIKMRFLLVPPWEEAYQLVYGSQDRVMSNYLKVFDAILFGSSSSANHCEVRFCDKPLFNDTYRVDADFITGPYMHNRDKHNKKISAQDFFTYELKRESGLHGLVKDEFTALWDECDTQLDWEKYRIISEKIHNSDLNDAEIQENIREAIVEISETQKEETISEVVPAKP